MASIPLTITNGTAPYTISVKMVGDGNERFLSYSSNILGFTGDTSGSNKTYNVTVTDSEGCIKTGVFELNCSITAGPSYEWDFLQPYCSARSGGTIVNGTLKLRNVVNGTRYKVCYGSQVFSPSCNANCATSDGFIVGSAADITITAPAQGQSQYVTVRVFNGDGCTGYTDVTFAQYSQKCSADEISFIIMDIRIAAGTNPCQQPPTNNYSFYAQITNAEIAEKTQKAISYTNIDQRNIPNNKEVPNVFISAPKTLGCGPGPFARFGFNMSGLKAAYPATTVFNFDIYALKTLGPNTSNQNCGGMNCDEIRPQVNMFRGVRLIKQDYPAAAGNPCCFSDFFREPLYMDNGTEPQGPHFYNYNITGYRKIGTLSFSYATNDFTYTHV